jgi:hypothetical protein
MARKQTPPDLYTFPPVYEQTVRRVIKAGRLVVEFDTERELMRERLKMSRYLVALVHYAPSQELVEMAKRVELRYSRKTLKVELIDRLGKHWTSKYSEAVPGTVDEAKESISLVEAELAKLRAKESQE